MQFITDNMKSLQELDDFLHIKDDEPLFLPT